MTKKTASLRMAGGVLLAFTVGVSPALAQLNVQHIKGPTGLKAGSQPAPHVYVIGPLVWVYGRHGFFFFFFFFFF